MTETNERHIITQAQNCASVIASVLAQTLLKRRPADRSLSSAFYEHREYGSRDRRLISETLFAVLRWWGWLSHLAPRPFGNAVEAHDEEAKLALSLEDFFPMFAAAWYLEGKTELPPAVEYWLDVARINCNTLKFLPVDASLLARKRYLRPFFKMDARLDFRDHALLPVWAGELLMPGADFHELVEWLQRRPPVWLRIHSQNREAVYKDLEESNFRAGRHPVMADAWCIEFSGGNLRATKSFREGAFEIQDAASQCVAHICAPKPGQQWWDACAGGGGKTLHLASIMQGKGSVLATDIREHKLQDLKLRARRAQFPNIRCKEWKGKDMPTFRNHFDGVLVDTPCSCSGTWRRNPDARWTTFPEEIEDFHKLQLQLLTNASSAVRPGGTLVYSTCSMFKRENIDVVEEFLANHPEFSLVPFACPLTERQTNGMNQVWPWDSDCDAMFTAKFMRVVDNEAK